MAVAVWTAPPSSQAADYEVGPDKAYQSVDAVPW